MTKLLCSTLAATLLCSSFISVSAFAQNQTQGQAAAKIQMIAALNDRLEIQGLKLLLVTREIDAKMPNLTNLRHDIWKANFKRSMTDRSSVGLDGGISLALSWYTLDTKLDILTYPLMGSGIVSVTSASMMEKGPSKEETAKKVINSEDVSYQVWSAVQKTAEQTAAIFSLDEAAQRKLHQALFNEVVAQADNDSSKANIKIDTLAVMLNQNLVNQETYQYAVDIRSLLKHHSQVKKSISQVDKEIQGETALEGMIVELSHKAESLPNSEQRDHLVRALNDARSELDFVRGQKASN